ncbi:MAG: lipocalin family protein [Treponemataceae bacterium]|nr:lipocalin family protein [Treponemataceae bacterium]
MLTRVETHSASLTQFALTGTETWRDSPANYIKKDPILIIGNQLYIQTFMVAEGTPSGIVGTWSVTYVYPEDDSTTGTYTPTYYKHVYIFSANGEFSVKIYESTTGVFGLPSQEGAATYIYSNGTLTMTMGSQSYSYKVTIYNGNILIFGDETSPSAAAYIKQ